MKKQTIILITFIIVIFVLVSGCSGIVPKEPSTSVPTTTPIVHPSKQTLTTKPTPAPIHSYLTVESNPPGATVEIGPKSSATQLGTGRIAGVTPLNIEIFPSDIRMEGAGMANLNVNLQKNGYYLFTQVINIEDGKLENGRTYKISAKLNPIGTY